MSDQVALALLAGVFLFGSFLSFYMSRIAHEHSDKIATGMKDGAPLPLSYFRDRQSAREDDPHDDAERICR